jgi:signal transduction histidine kinase
VDTDALLRDILETYPNLHAHRAHIEVKGKLPMVLANEAALTQCFSNLLGNAFKFMREGREPHVRIWSELHDGQVRLFFEDNGIGIAGHLHARIFDLFERVSPTRDGSGIGLSIVNQSIERMGGKVGVRSTPDQGSLFWLELRPA